ncbi:hypothetical protein TcBrA4_0052270 [Trypanosoma cruzi]|nr:hypothetical protein TcBrA4_0052270 [Trypanosoma cruzi]
MGRHQAEKVERRVAIEDGMRTQGMAEPHGATAGRLGAQHLMAHNSGHPQDNAANPTRPREQQEGIHGGCGQFAAAENFAYPQEYAAVQQQDGEEPYEGVTIRRSMEGVHRSWRRVRGVHSRRGWE